MNEKSNTTETQCNKQIVNGSVFTEKDLEELNRLTIKVKYKNPTYEDYKRVDELTRLKWKSEGII